MGLSPRGGQTHLPGRQDLEGQVGWGEALPGENVLQRGHVVGDRQPKGQVDWTRKEWGVGKILRERRGQSRLSPAAHPPSIPQRVQASVLWACHRKSGLAKESSLFPVRPGTLRTLTRVPGAEAV